MIGGRRQRKDAGVRRKIEETPEDVMISFRLQPALSEDEPRDQMLIDYYNWLRDQNWSKKDIFAGALEAARTQTWSPSSTHGVAGLTAQELNQRFSSLLSQIREIVEERLADLQISQAVPRTTKKASSEERQIFRKMLVGFMGDDDDL